jgi:Leucine-rich repeat (LRR) protein
MTSLVELHLSFNNLTTIPTSIGLLHNLQFLTLDHNQIQSIPTSVRILILREYH